MRASNPGALHITCIIKRLRGHTIAGRTQMVHGSWAQDLACSSSLNALRRQRNACPLAANPPRVSPTHLTWRPNPCTQRFLAAHML